MRVWAAMVAAARVSSPQKVCALYRASSIRSVISPKLASARLRHSAMTFCKILGMLRRSSRVGGTRTAVPRAACSAANAAPLKALSHQVARRQPGLQQVRRHRALVYRGGHDVTRGVVVALARTRWRRRSARGRCQVHRRCIAGR